MITDIRIPLEDKFFLNVSKCTHPTSHVDHNLIYYPGLAAMIESDVRLLSLLKTANVYVIHPRGRGFNSSATMDYSLEAHTKDLQQIIEFLNLDSYQLICYSYACLYGISLFQTGIKVMLPKRLILCDYPAHERKLDLAWIEFMSGKYAHLPRSFYEEFASSSKDIDLYKILSCIQIPVTIFKGGHTSAPKSFLSKQDLKRYSKAIKNCRVEYFKSGHFFKDLEPSKFIEKILN